MLKKIILLLIVFTFIASPVWAGVDEILGISTFDELLGIATVDEFIGAGSVTGGEVSCSTSESYSNTGASSGDYDIKDSDEYTYVGQTETMSAEIDVCQVNFWLTDKKDLDPGDFTVEIWVITQEEFPSYVSTAGTSSAVEFDTSWSDTEVEFTFSPPVTLSAAEYTFVITHDGAESADKEVELEYTSGAGLSKWDSARNREGISSTLEAKFKIFGTE